MTSLQRTLVAAPCYIFTSEIKDNLSTRDKTISLKVSLVRRFHCIMYCKYLDKVVSCKQVLPAIRGR